MSLAAITTLRRGLAEWAHRGGNRRFLCEDQERQLRDALDRPQQRARAHVAAWMLGTWHLGHGLLRVLDGEAEAFDEARVGQSLRRCALLLRARRGSAQKTKLPFSTVHGAWTVMLGLALDDPGAEELYELLRVQPDTTFGPGEELPLFTRELLELRAGQRPTVTAGLGPYQHVLMHWRGEPRVLAQRLADLLDLHLAAGRGGPGRGSSGHGPGGAFDDPACRLYPVEVLAVRAVRTWLDLPTPKVDHPLMFTNLGTMTPRTPWPRDELVHRLERELLR